MRVRRPALLSLLLAPACADDVVCPSPGRFALTQPDGFAELVPGGRVTLAWTSAGGDGGADVELALTATDGGDPIELPAALVGDGQLTWDGQRLDGSLAPPANYRIGGTVGRIASCGGLELTPDDLHLVVVQGLRMPDAPITFTGSQLTRMITVTTVTRSPLMVSYALDPSATTDGDELVFARATVPAELAPVARSYPFSGMTVDATAIPDGEYDLVALVGAPVAYRALGPRLTWHPAQ